MLIFGAVKEPKELILGPSFWVVHGKDQVQELICLRCGDCVAQSVGQNTNILNTLQYMNPPVQIPHRGIFRILISFLFLTLSVFFFLCE